MSTSTVPPNPSRFKNWLGKLRPAKSFSNEAAPTIRGLDRDLVMGLSTKRVPNFRQLQSLPAVLSPNERRWARLFSATGVASIILIIVVLLAGHLTSVPQSGGTLTEGIVGVPQFINPVLARPDTADADVTNIAFRGLLHFDKNFKVVPDMAKSVSQSTDGKVITATLRPNVTWSDGQPLTVDDVVYTYTTIADPQYKSPWAAGLHGVKVEKKDNQTVTFTTDSPTPSFINLLTLGIIPQHAWGDQTGSTFPLAELNLKPISNGPYKFSSLTKDRSGSIKSMSFVRNKSFPLGAPMIDRIVVKFYPDQDTALQALDGSAIDTLGNLRLGDTTSVEKHSVVSNIPLAQITGVFFSQRTNPALKVKEVRQALAMAVNRSSLVENTLHGQAKVAYGPILPGFLGYNPNLQHYDNQSAAAMALLDQAGWKTGANGIRQKGSQQLTFVLTTVNETDLVNLANDLAKSWRAIGAQVQVKTVDASRIDADVISTRSYEALLFGQRFTADGDQYAYWDSSQQRSPGFALAIFFNKNLDTDVEDAHTTTDQTKRLKDYLDFQNIIADNIPAIIIDQAVYSYAHPKNLRGFNDTNLVAPTNRFDDISSWYLKTSLTWGKKKG